jgi:hypothetical protein
MGIIDEEYVQKTGESEELVGRRVSISEKDVLALVANLRRLAGSKGKWIKILLLGGQKTPSF